MTEEEIFDTFLHTAEADFLFETMQRLIERAFWAGYKTKEQQIQT